MNNTIVYVGTDIHNESFPVCYPSFATDKLMYQKKMPSNYKIIQSLSAGMKPDA